MNILLYLLGLLGAAAASSSGSGSDETSPPGNPDSAGPKPKPEPEPEPEPKPKPPQAGEDVFLGANGKIVLEAESAEASGAWTKTKIDGETVMLWDNDGENSYKQAQNGESLSFDIQPDENGTYHIALHSGRVKDVMAKEDLQGGRTDTGNDAWIKVTDLGSGKVILSPTKLFTNLGNSDEDLRWGDTFDKSHKQSDATVKLKAGTEYEIEVFGRSAGFAIDRITLSNDGVLKSTNAPESDQSTGGTSPVTPPPSSGEGSADGSVATTAEFDGIRLWVANDISEVDDAAAVSALMLGARNISESDNNITGSADKLHLEGAFIDSDFKTSKGYVDDVEDLAQQASERYGVDVYSPRSDYDIGGDAKAWETAMTKSLDTAYGNNEQVVIISGGPTIKPAEVISDWLNSGSTAAQADKAVWLLKGGFTQVTHGWSYKNNDDLDYTRDPGKVFFNIRTTDGPNVQDVYEDLYDEIEDVAEDGIGLAYSQAEYNQLEKSFVANALLVSIEDQNNTDAVRGDADKIGARIEDDLARDAALTYSKDGGDEIDFSDLGMLAILYEDGDKPFDLDDIEEILSDSDLF